MSTKQKNEKPRAAADKTAHMSCEFNPCEHGYADAGDCPMCYDIGMMEIRAQRADADKIDTIRRLEAQRDELLAIIKALLDAHTPYMIRKASAEARLAIAKAEDWPLIETRAFQLKAGVK
jgi:hypothetical protein